MIFSYLLNMQSHPSWVCGLKQLLLFRNIRRFRVTPFVGVWIETLFPLLAYHKIWSHPSWVCGLKLSLLLIMVVLMSHTLRGCVD